MKYKRSRNINLPSMLKRSLFPVSALAAAVMFTGCGSDSEDGYLYTTVEECIDAHPGKDEICQEAWEEAQGAADESGPRYGTQELCEIEFGPGQCRFEEGGSFWTPFMAGYILSEVIDEVDDYFDYKKKKKKKHYYSSTPVFLSSRGGLSYYGLNEQKIGKPGKRNVGISGSAYEKKAAKTYTKSTVRRGGFGSTVRSSSSGFGGKSWGG